ncbi:Hypothetical protein NTJ_05491 [Nesidiocoris tenuis]|uniref:Uncharacterized protein n=1 Tax=Nesidiocoris tenuis TaxID=355587 RepID=A0ABN7AKA0_9HEMI|nr:Hypothetical protein NTJ_05491 [Nesidiocoris tenuis]
MCQQKLGLVQICRQGLAHAGSGRGFCCFSLPIYQDKHRLTEAAFTHSLEYSFALAFQPINLLSSRNQLESVLPYLYLSFSFLPSGEQHFFVFYSGKKEKFTPYLTGEQ